MVFLHESQKNVLGRWFASSNHDAFVSKNSWLCEVPASSCHSGAKTYSLLKKKKKKAETINIRPPPANAFDK